MGTRVRQQVAAHIACFTTWFTRYKFLHTVQTMHSIYSPPPTADTRHPQWAQYIDFPLSLLNAGLSRPRSKTSTISYSPSRLDFYPIHPLSSPSHARHPPSPRSILGGIRIRLRRQDGLIGWIRYLRKHRMDLGGIALFVPSPPVHHLNLTSLPRRDTLTPHRSSTIILHVYIQMRLVATIVVVIHKQEYTALVTLHNYIMPAIFQQCICIFLPSILIILHSILLFNHHRHDDFSQRALG